MMDESLYLGFDLSTQQLKAVVVTSSLQAVKTVIFDFDADSTGFQIHKGVITSPENGEVVAPIVLWLQAFDNVLQRLKATDLDLSRVRAISGAGQQHGSVYWHHDAPHRLRNLDSSQSLEAQLPPAFSHLYSPNWQDASTQEQCDLFDSILGDAASLAEVTGSKAHHRFTGPQILKFRQKHNEAYRSTLRISLVSSFIASIFLGRIAPLDISDVCGMNLWDIRGGCWNEKLLQLASNGDDPQYLKSKLGDVPRDGGHRLGDIGTYFVRKYGFSTDCAIVMSTGDNPATILALPLRAQDAIVSLGTSTTFLMSTPEYKPEPPTHFMNHPTTPGLYMFMLCYKNGGLAREKIRDDLNAKHDRGLQYSPWSLFNKTLTNTSPLSYGSAGRQAKLGLYFPKPEIVPNLPAGRWRFFYHMPSKTLAESDQDWVTPEDDVRAIVESQLLSLRLRSQDLVSQPSLGLPAQARRIYLVGGSSRNRAIAKVVGEVLGGSEGIYQLDVGENACALGAAYKAVWSLERQDNETFEDLVGTRWDESKFVKRIADGYQPGVFERYDEAVDGFRKMEAVLLDRYAHS